MSMRMRGWHCPVPRNKRHTREYNLHTPGAYNGCITMRITWMGSLLEDNISHRITSSYCHTLAQFSIRPFFSQESRIDMALKALILLTSVFGAALTGTIPVSPRQYPVDLPIEVVEGSTPDADALELTESREIISLFHTRLGQNATSKLVEADVAAADAFWQKVLSNATSYVGGVTRIQAYAPTSVFNATSVLVWFQSAGTGWPNDFLNTSPQHHLAFSGAGTSDPEAAIESIETWGAGPTTYFKGISAEKPSYIPALPEFAAQITLALVLKDGTVFAHSVTAARDLEDTEGVEIYQAIWIPDNVPGYVVTGLTEHITVEFTNWLRFAYRRATGT
ncbi:hypothetical protein GGR57DRAFT_450559 [Xylariaceae sp. FL1272]|nr:hypothetical protein GGR57DRAFT_450559 [Xylariaceae sp. FL1272]